MNPIMRHCYLLFFFLLATATTYAQQKNGSVKGMVIDTALKQQAIASATITILKRSDSSLVSFTITDAEGRFEMTGIP
uniref:carboxypeptidase-like regulatory domain-containing protein n=1 Tax=Pedobacter borealis TaxID=475254 RepID=UPI0012F79AA8